MKWRLLSNFNPDYFSVLRRFFSYFPEEHPQRSARDLTDEQSRRQSPL
jgi:hypothetical protein